MEEFSVAQQVLPEPDHGGAIERKGNAEFAWLHPGMLVVDLAMIEVEAAQRNSKTDQAENYERAK